MMARLRADTRISTLAERLCSYRRSYRASVLFVKRPACGWYWRASAGIMIVQDTSPYICSQVS